VLGQLRPAAEPRAFSNGTGHAQPREGGKR
jgi:hypothetical protein